MGPFEFMTVESINTILGRLWSLWIYDLLWVLRHTEVLTNLSFQTVRKKLQMPFRCNLQKVVEVFPKVQ